MKKTSKQSFLRRGFTLAELLVAMTITIVLVSLTLVITGSAIDAWKGARTEIRAAGQAKIMLNALGRDLESVVIRQGNNDSQWLIASSKVTDVGPESESSPNAGRLTFFTAASDRYDGNAGSREKIGGDAANRDADKGGDVSAVSYQLDFADPVWGDQSENFSTFVLYRKLLNPDLTYAGVTSSKDLEKSFDERGGQNDLDDLMCENVYEFTITFIVAYRDTNGDDKTTSIPVMSTTNGGLNVVKSFAINGTGLAPNENSKSEFAGGRVTAVELAITVLSDDGVAILKKSPFKSTQDKAIFLEEKGYRYTRSVSIPQG
ncbi:MAG: type II secretory pathway pseudopilin PulG [Paracoccaceae bacterium]|jgi:type II secretory pathway pseudopilin PulG